MNVLKQIMIITELVNHVLPLVQLVTMILLVILVTQLIYTNLNVYIPVQIKLIQKITNVLTVTQPDIVKLVSMVMDVPLVHLDTYYIMEFVSKPVHQELITTTENVKLVFQLVPLVVTQTHVLVVKKEPIYITTNVYQLVQIRPMFH